ncbi:MAG: hypothetical protein ACKOB6_07505, partial [Candidatus Kapaibacterium sp.]
PPPPPPPPPAVIVPEKRVVAEVGLWLRGQEVVSDTLIEVPVPLVVEETREALVPLIHYAKNGTGLRARDTLMVQETARLMNLQPSLRVTLTVSQAAGEDASMARTRGDSLKRLLQEYGIDDWKIRVQTEQSPPQRYAELDEEARRVSIALSNRQVPVLVTVDTVRPDIAPVECEIRWNAGADTVLASAVLRVYDGRREQADSVRGGPGRSNVQIPTDGLFQGRPYLLRSTLSVRDVEGRGAERSTILCKWNPRIRIRETRVRNIITGTDGISDTDAMVLGFFDFDEDEFASVDRNVVESARRHQASGGRVRIIAMTDALGDAGENAKLAKRRGQAALAVLGLKDADIEVRTGGLHNNRTPEGRSRNRSVLVVCR